jgi:glycosyltransferase involved in cell wall biosynthesis
MKVFMLGWEFPPFISGGLGTACYGLTKALSAIGLEIQFVLPTPIEGSENSHVKMLTPYNSLTREELTQITEEMKNISFSSVPSAMFSGYSNPEQYRRQYEQIIQRKKTETKTVTDEVPDDPILNPGYSGDMFEQIQKYAAAAVRLAMKQQFDIVHAHDWMTYQAGIAVSAVTGKPLVVHVHSTEFDRSGEHVNQMIYDIERRGMHAADKVIAVSHLTRNIIITRYGVTGDKIEVAYNGVERNGELGLNYDKMSIKSDEKIVLFLGRITMQKGPEYFLMAAKKVLEVIENAKFVMAGSGDMMHRIIEMAAELGIGNKVVFTGFLRGQDVEKVYQMADLYVMPSVSEPFGIAPLEALNYDVPVLISKQSGVAEVLTHVLKVDFWDVKEMANKIIAVLKHPPLQMTLKEHANFEVTKLKWEDTARRCADIYNNTLMRV